MISTIDNAYNQVISSLDSTAQDHTNLSELLITQVADASKALEKKHEDMKKKVRNRLHWIVGFWMSHFEKQLQFYQRVLADKDKVYANRTKVALNILKMNKSNHQSLWLAEAEGSIPSTSITSHSDTTQYDEECMEVESYRQKQVTVTLNSG